ncbi:metal ABC transporter permease [Anaerococcus sp. NML200537]|uniref:metal ABC transporter permease n=1 Tax=unclassified Anaerococcus TaxID=2614126 RepID=UPI000D0B69A2|nr:MULTISPECIES: metal ABC transporter permease [unclassified Anaerococcus]MCW6701800.1 metal ABC transporter permease [Anaerococcus sp. NML200537]
MTDALIVLILTSISCSLLGIFLVLRKLSMMTDAISHSVLLGIVLAFFLVRDLDSPLLILGASLMGLVTVFLIESIGKLKLAKLDDATAIVYPLLFSIAVILISKFFRNVHLDTDIVMMGEVIFSSMIRTEIFGIEMSKSILEAALSLVCVIAFIGIFYRKLKIGSFDEEFASLVGISTGLIFYSLMTITSFVAVTSFNNVGAIIVISFFIGPAAIALLFARSLREAFLLATLASIINPSIGFYLAINFNVSITGMIATINMASYLALIIIKKYILDRSRNYGKNQSSKRGLSNNNIQIDAGK